LRGPFEVEPQRQRENQNVKQSGFENGKRLEQAGLNIKTREDLGKIKTNSLKFTSLLESPELSISAGNYRLPIG
jgi:hypothetical protein